MKKSIVSFLTAIILFSNLPGFGFSKDSQLEKKISTIPGVVVARLKPGAEFNTVSNAIQSAPSLRFNRVFPFHSKASALSRIYNIYFDPALPPEEFAAELSRWDIFDYVEPKYLSFICETTPNDSLLIFQNHLAQVNMFKAWDIQKGAATTVIAIVDNGTDYQHPDLSANIWINQAEARGSSGIDDDQNGYIDDMLGWDFGENDNDPIYGTDESSITVHGTHTAGIAAAVTNNFIGISGVSWNCSFMPIKVSTDDNTYQIPFGYEGIVYAADNGAQVISNSWGRRGLYSQYEQDIINYAVSRGSIVVAAAGNSNIETNFYPASYVHVVAVTAVNELDIKASYSNYGKFIDLSAPGGDLSSGHPGILSTVPIARGSYGEMSGTSMACPLVAGIMGLLVRQFPDFNLLQLSRQAVITSDQIDYLNREYQGLMGHGRINAFRALTEEVQDEEPAKVDLFQIAVYDSIWGNGNFLLERNETIGVDVWYRNYAVSPARNLVVRLTSDDADLIMQKNLTTISFLPADSIFVIRKQLNFRIDSRAMPHLAQLILTYSMDNGEGGCDTVSTFIGKSAILFVDDDENDTRNIDAFYTAVFDQLEIPYLKWDHALLGTPPPKTIAHFPIIIWSCEWAFPSLSPEDRIALQYYLNQNGNLFISGQDIGWDLADPASDHYSESSIQFYRQHLHALYQADDSGSQTVIGVPGSIGQGMKFKIYQPKIAYHYQFPEWIEPASGADLAFQYENGKGAGISFIGNYKVLNLGFGFEAIDSQLEESPSRFSPDRSELMQRILNQLGPIQHTPLADQEMAPDSLNFSVELSPPIDDLQSLALYWKTDAMTNFAELLMTAMGSNRFEGTLNLQLYQSKMQYYFLLKTPYYQFQLPVTGKNQPYAFYIGLDKAPPEFFHIPLKDIFVQTDQRIVEVLVEDNIAVNTNSVWLHYGTDAEGDSVWMIYKGNQWYQASIPLLAGPGDSISYYFSAADLADVPNKASSPQFSYKIGIEGFEYGLDFWTADSNSWAIDNQEAHSGRCCISSSPDGNYGTNMDNHLNSKWGLKRNLLKDMELSFWTRHQLEENRDFGFVEISLDHGADWQVAGNSITGVFENWYEAVYDLSDFYMPGNDTLLLRFRFKTDSRQNQPMSGWFIDDIAIRCNKASSISDKNMRQKSNMPAMEIYSNWPNPFNAVTKINYQLSIPGDVTFEIFNLLGQSVFKRSVGFQSAGQFDLVWNGVDENGQPSESGIYFGRITLNGAKSNSQIIKMIYLK